MASGWDAEARARHSRVMRAALASQEARARIGAASRANWARPEFRAKMTRSPLPVSVEVPRWVPADLAEIYLTIAERRGEEMAASEVRRLKRRRACCGQGGAA